ncbi:MAG: transposase [Thermoguttaceae bacterium]|nr:transposase [Thermoguttaceae bacterium]
MTLLIDSGYASNEVISGANAAGVNVIARLRKNSVFYELPSHPEKKARPSV